MVPCRRSSSPAHDASSPSSLLPCRRTPTIVLVVQPATGSMHVALSLASLSLSISFVLASPIGRRDATPTALSAAAQSAIVPVANFARCARSFLRPPLYRGLS